MVAPFRNPRKVCWCGHGKAMHEDGRGKCVGYSNNGCRCLAYRAVQKKYATEGMRD